ncbi:soluble quino protein glucose/sorbosone dehydrogenase [Podospora australis]|uniref:Soluble quino protein glucose/sorbosone dehydrogenase n=1 Tax=Podospora australis TaxID=1536484 RepID=A0AAN7AL84_9PEZI|nr:soluble quino protein glucose/sorbosone dehydrogenase [Podospora australis]
MRLINQAATAALVLFTTHTLAQDATTCATVLTPAYSPPVVAEGWQAQLVAHNLRTPRGLKFDTKGALLVVDAQRGIIHLNLTDTGGVCVDVSRKTTLISLSDLNHGIEISPDGTHLYASSREAVWRWDYDPSVPSVSNRRLIIQNMTNSDHATRTLYLSPSSPDLLLVSRGSAANIDPLSALQENGIAQIRAFNISNLTSSSSVYNYPTDGLLVGWGLRNSVGIAEHPVTGGLYSVENNIDRTSRMGVDIHEENPGEELNFHGKLSDPDNDLIGGHYGYPHCFPLFNTTDFPEQGGLVVGNQFSLENEADLNDEVCAREYIPPRLTFTAHMAPLDIKFSPEGTKAYVSFHGSWNRDNPAGYKVSVIKFKNVSGEPEEPRNSTKGLAVDIFANKDNNCRQNTCLRPAGLAVDARGRVFVSSDASGEVWVLEQTGDGGNGGGAGTEEGGEEEESTNAAAAVVARPGGEGWAVVGLTTLVAFFMGIEFVAL